ncbi:hypothetical protein F7725_019097 [Dissostichus mawsoni]|uniref:HAT C-terminal dimerisation domain-containing protein n=1 Tax=Dissostichus mawsoni TaxID=36200 RepID=A0A7J5XTF4_DISMA|nr:hypothetical protein F7725_019097 [Dissostichus mawsoni]
MEKTAEVLAPFEELTRDVSNPTASAADVIPAITALKRVLSREKTTDQGVRTMKSTLLEAVETRFAEVEEKPLYSIATLVDPRYKDRQVQFFTKSGNLRLATDNLILEVAKIERAASEEPEAAEPMRKTPRQEASSSLGSVLDEILEENQLEARFLCAPCTSVDSERLFSAVSNVLDEKRNRLSPDRASNVPPGGGLPSSWRKHNNGNLKKRSSKITLTTDAWTSIATEAYLGVTCHYINENWEMVSFVLCTKPLEDRQTGDNIALWIEEVAEKFDFSLHDDVQAIVHDNAANVVKALRILEEKHGVASLRCAGHTTQLIVNLALKELRINKALGAARSLVTYFHSSEVAT